MKPASRLFILLTIALGGCGRLTELRPPEGQPLPVKPLLAKATPTAEQLLAQPTYARPERIDELIKQSEPRRPDRFDLPPPDGGLVPVLPETDEPSSSQQKGPVDPR
jgi:hypothetical protein